MANGTTHAPGRQLAASHGPIQLQPPVLLPMSEDEECRAISLLAELIGTRLGRSGPDLMFGPVNGLLDLRPAADAAEPTSPAA